MFNFGAKYLLQGIHNVRQAFFLEIVIPKTKWSIKVFEVWWFMGLPQFWVTFRKMIIRLSRFIANLHLFKKTAREIRVIYIMTPAAILTWFLGMLLATESVLEEKTFVPSYVYDNVQDAINVVNYSTMSMALTKNTVEIILLSFIAFKLVNSNSVKTSFTLLNITILFIIAKVYNIGLEPFVYFFAISEISGSFILLAANLKKQTKWSQILTPKLLLLLIPMVVCTWNTPFNNWVYFNFFLENYLCTWNDFQTILLVIFFSKYNLLIILTIIYFYTFTLVYLFSGNQGLNKTTAFHSTLKTNLNLWKKNILTKWGV